MVRVVCCKLRRRPKKDIVNECKKCCNLLIYRAKISGFIGKSMCCGTTLPASTLSVGFCQVIFLRNGGFNRRIL